MERWQNEKAIAQERFDSGMSLVAIAAAIGIGRNAISGWLQATKEIVKQ